MAVRIWTAGQGGSDELARIVLPLKPIQLGGTVTDACSRIGNLTVDGGYPVLIVCSEGTRFTEWIEFIQTVKSNVPSCFVICASNDPLAPSMRFGLTNAGVAMISNDPSGIRNAINIVAQQKAGQMPCPHCALHLDEDSLWRHNPLYHINARNVGYITCPICSKTCSPELENFAVHLRNAHGPCGRGEEQSEYDHRDERIYAFALVVCIRTYEGKRQMLLVQEFASSGFWLPGGRVDPGEGLQAAALRECKEEAGCDVNLTGVLQFQYSPSKRGNVRLRVLFLAEPRDASQVLKSLPDYESMGALWVDLDAIQELYHRRMLRGSEPHWWAKHVLNNGEVYGLSVLEAET